MKNIAEYGYNERLFSGGLRSRLHMARFRWLADRISRYGCSCASVIELGCFDGKLIDLLPTPPERYLGLDANWEGGLDLARERWKGDSRYRFEYCSSPDDVEIREEFDISVAMETIEHLPESLVSPYLEKLATCTRDYLFITVPNEKGPVFLGKWLAKRLLSNDFEHYSQRELVNATLGRMHRVPRYDHKGFDYEQLISEVNLHFEVVEVSGHPFGILPPSLCFGIGIVARRQG